MTIRTTVSPRPRRRATGTVLGIGVLTALALAAALALPSEAAPGKVVNPSLEQDGDRNGVPDCFTPAGWGTSTATFTRVREGHQGRWAERLTVSDYEAGDRKLVLTMARGCAPRVVPGQRYEASVWYRADVWSVLVAYVQRGGLWQFWTQGPGQPPTSTWRRSVLDLPPVPADGTAVSFGQAIIANGTIVTDDYAVGALASPTPSSTTAPGGSTATTARPGTPGPTGSTVTTVPSATTGPVPTTGPAPTVTTTTAPPQPCSAGYVALGFDDGPDMYTDQLLDILEAKHAKATHFLIGSKITPDLVPVVKRMAALGHPVGNHTWTHPHLTELSDDDIRKELTETTDRFVAIGLPRPAIWRPPFEDTDDRVRAIASSLGMDEVLWDLDTNDWMGITSEETVHRIIDGAHAGTIVLVHERIANTVDAMPAVIDGLRAKGFCLGVIHPSPTYNEQTRSYAEVGP